ncbi:2-oxoglutarate (2OG) and Fe(II)-dependent oxygenase superfamily protein [Heracleum sosnowskyi]|uniref:2-oxoglutarate (2OG) and Fe(II)-dependent oxygenase superfamily protein n=1 Tax=Heracleum sosnowskyi TaxID=360622 RepID=A0AAD8JJ70_9APIA|nr:2-oxoglutarate (2OG) and Fe(II)-dependent oxygenase superfamily protein [Heracleum sosnowskyi]
MAGTHESVVLLKPVQELAVDCNIPPQRYIHKRSDEDIFVNSRVIDIPVIDLNSIQSSSPSAEKQLEKLRTSLASCGCFQVIGHGMTGSFLHQVHSIGRDFFALSLKEKLKCSRTAEDTEGYGNDSELSDHQILDWNDRLYLTTNPQDQMKYQFWPQNPENFREILQEYTEKIIMLNQVVFKALSRSLNLQEKCFLDQYDGSAITFLLQDNEVDGLQVLKDDQWFSVPTVPNALLVNVGDQLEIMSNGIFKSPLHRVVTSSERERITVAVFCSPDSSRYIEPAEELISETSPKLYKKIKNYVGIFFENYQQGKRAIEAVKM